MKQVPLLILDLDGTVRKGYDELGRFVNGPDDVEVFPEAVLRIGEWSAAGGRVIGVTNQGGISLRHVSVASVEDAILETNRQVGWLFDAIEYCPHYPDTNWGKDLGDPNVPDCFCRKPRPGMVFRCMQRISRMEVYPPSLALVVGDRPEDEGLAAAIGVAFATVEDPESIERLRHAMMFDAPVCVPTPPPECRFQDRAPERLFPPWHP